MEKQSLQSIDELQSQIYKNQLEIQTKKQMLDVSKIANREIKQSILRIKQTKKENQSGLVQLYEGFVSHIKNKQNENQQQDQQKRSQPDIKLNLEESLLELIDGIVIEWQRKKLREWQELQTKKALLVGFLGDFKTGKTYMLSKLTKRNFGHSLTERTVGLNFVFGESKISEKIYYVDTAEFGEPLQIFDKYNTTHLDEKERFTKNTYQYLDLRSNYLKFMAGDQQAKHSMSEELAYNLLKEPENINRLKEQKMSERIVTDKFMQNFVMEGSSVVIVMVTRLSKQQETTINYLMNLTTKPEFRQKKIIIVHNFYELFFEEEIEAQIRKDILSCFQVEEIESFANGVDGVKTKFWIDKSKNPQNPIVHFVLGNEEGFDMRFKTKYNDFALAQINNIIYAQKNFGQFNLIDMIIQYFSENFQKYVKIDFDESNQAILKKKRLDVKMQKFPFPLNPQKYYYALICQQLPKDHQKYRMISAKSAMDVDLKRVNFNDQYNPPYNITDDKNRFVVVFDIAGLKKYATDIKAYVYQNDKTQKHVLVLAGQRDPNLIPIHDNNKEPDLKKIDNEYNDREIQWGEVYQEVELCDLEISLMTKEIKRDYKLKPDEPGYGMLVIIIPKSQQFDDNEMLLNSIIQQ